MPVEMMVDPTRTRAVRRPPKWASPDRANNATDHQADRPGDYQARAGTESRADGIRV
jgi:hypothetical protein